MIFRQFFLKKRQKLPKNAKKNFARDMRSPEVDSCIEEITRRVPTVVNPEGFER